MSENLPEGTVWECPEWSETYEQLLTALEATDNPPLSDDPVVFRRRDSFDAVLEQAG